MAKSQPSYQVNRAASKRRAERLQSYLSEHVWDPTTRKSLADFICESKEECTASAKRRGAVFYPAQGYGVGPWFDLSTADGVPFRVLIVPMEAGGGGKYASIAQRRTEPLKPCPERNPHMKGVTFALQLAFGLPVTCSDPDAEMLHFTNRMQPAHLFECYAMANSTLCSAVATAGGKAGRGTAVMRKNCARHLQAAIGILQPTLVISQGSGLVKTLQGSFGVTHPMSTNLGENLASCCDLDGNGNQFVWAALRHPTRNWSTINQPYFRETVVPTLQQARKRALKLAQPV
jgi:hypothetical protein